MKPTSITLKAIALAGLLPLAAFGQTANSGNGPTDSSHTVTGTTANAVDPVGSGTTIHGTGAAHDSTGGSTVTTSGTSAQ